MTVMDIIVGTQEWTDFSQESEACMVFESKDGPNYITATVYRDTPSGAGGCTLYVSVLAQDPLPSPTIKISPKLGDLMEKMGAPADYADELLEIRGTFLEGVQPGDVHHAQFAEEHPSIGSAVLRLAALTHAHSTGQLLGDLDLSKGLVMLDALTTSS